MPGDNVRIAWAPQPGPQTAACASPVEDLHYGGARGGGKTDFLLGDFGGHAGQYGKHARGIIFRRTFDELIEIERRARDIYGLIGATYRLAAREFVFPNGATLLLRYLDRDTDADHYQGHQYTWMGFDQLEQWPDPSPIDRLWGSMRSVHGVPCYRRSTSNPPAPAWVKDRYVEPEQPFHPFKYQPQPERAPNLTVEAVFIPAFLEDNPLLTKNDPNYEGRLAAAGSEELYRAWRHGDWDAMVGQVFSEWRQDLHLLDDSFQIPFNWRWAAGGDWGYRNPGWLGIFSSGPDGDVICENELYFRQQHAYEVGYTFGLMCHPYPVEYAALDEQMWQKSGVSAPTLAEEFQMGLFDAYGDDRERSPKVIQSSHGPGSRHAKLIVFHRYLAWKETELEDGSRIVQPWNRPLLRFKRQCRAAIRTIPALPYDRNKPEDIDTEAEDHAYDGVAAYLMSRPPLADHIPRPTDPDRHPGTSRSGRRRWQEAAERPAAYTGGGFRAPRREELVPLSEGDA